MTYKRLFMFLPVTVFTIAVMILSSSAFAQTKPAEKVDSTLLFRQIPTDEPKAPSVSDLDIFSLPDIELPPINENAEKTTSSSTKTETTARGTLETAPSTPNSVLSSSSAKRLPSLPAPSEVGQATAPSFEPIIATAPTPTATTNPVASKNAAITLPIPMIDIGISKKALPSLGDNDAASSPTRPSMPALPERMVDASAFDVAGIFLGMNPKEAVSAASEYGFELVDSVYDIPEFLVWRYKEACKNDGFLVYRAMKNCVDSRAEEKEERYISEISLSKPSLKEKIKVLFTSNFGGNMAYKITYVSEGDYSLGTNTEAVYKKRQRRRLFWKRVLEKYGAPSDLTQMIWTEGFDKPSLKALMHRSNTNGMLVLENPSITDKDAYEMYRHSRELPPLSDFSF